MITTEEIKIPITDNLTSEYIEEYLKNYPSKFRDKHEGCERNLKVVPLKGEPYDGSDEEAAEGDTRLNMDLDILRWAITKIENNFYIISTSYIK